MNRPPIDPFRQNHPSEGTLRIRRISRFLKAMVLLYFVAMPLFGTGWSLFRSHGGSTGWHWAAGNLSVADQLVAAFTVVICLGIAVTFYRLLNLWETGVFFSKTNVRLLRWLGHLAFGNGLLGVVAPVVSSGLVTFPSIIISPFNSPWVVGGLFVIMLSYIMEEACKLREDQDLTV